VKRLPSSSVTLLLVLAGSWIGASLVGLGLRRLAVNRNGRWWAYTRLAAGTLEVAAGPLMVATVVCAGVVTPDLLAGADPQGSMPERFLAWAARKLGAFGVRAVVLVLGGVLFWDHWREWVQDGRLVREEWARIRTGDYAGAVTRRQRSLDRYGV